MLSKITKPQEIKAGDLLVVVSTNMHGGIQIKGVDEVFSVDNEFYHYYPHQVDGSNAGREFSYSLNKVNKDFEYYRLDTEMPIDAFLKKYADESSLNIFFSQYSEIMPEILGVSSLHFSWILKENVSNIYGYLKLRKFIHKYEDIYHKAYFSEKTELSDMISSFKRDFFLHL